MSARPDPPPLRDVRCTVCGTKLFRAAGLGQVEIVCPKHRADPAHRRPQLFTIGGHLAPPKKPC